MDVDLYGLFKDNQTFDYDDYEYKDSPYPSKTSLAVFPLLYTVAMLWGLLGNGLVLAVLWRKRLRWSVMDIFIFYLSLTDSLLLLTMPLWLVDAVKGWIMGTALCKLTGALFQINFYSGLFMLTCFIGDHYLSTVHGVQKFTHRVAHSCCVIIWLLSVLLSIPDWVFLGLKKHGSFQECVHSYSPDSWRLASRLPHHLSFLLVTLMLLFCCSSILVRLWSNSKCHQKKTSQRTSIMAALVLFFFIFWTPYNISFIVNTSGSDRVSVAELSEFEGRSWTASRITAIFGLLHCIVNPTIYFCLSKEIRRRTLKMITMKSFEENRRNDSLWDSLEDIGNPSIQEEQGPLQAMSDITPTSQTQSMMEA